MTFTPQWDFHFIISNNNKQELNFNELKQTENKVEYIGSQKPNFRKFGFRDNWNKKMGSYRNQLSAS